MKKIQQFIRDESGDSIIVEATFLFPFIIMIFMGIVLLAIYLPRQSQLQEATELAVTALTTEQSDSFIKFNDNTLKYQTLNYSQLTNVYVELFRNITINENELRSRVDRIVNNHVRNSILQGNNPNVSVTLNLKDYIVYKELHVTAAQIIRHPVNLSLVGIPNTTRITATSKGTVQNGDEFIRNVDIAVDLAKFVDSQLGISEALTKIKNEWFS